MEPPEHAVDAALTHMGWDSGWRAAWEALAERGQGLEPGRVVEDRRVLHRVVTAGGEDLYEVRPELLRDARRGIAERPVVGDWVGVRSDSAQRGVIHFILPRRGQFVRRRARGEVRAQVLVANADAVLILTALDADFSVRRLERYLALAHEAGVRPIVVLTKPDLHAAPGRVVEEIGALWPDVAVRLIDPRRATDLVRMRQEVRAGTTVALLGSSGVGKSTLVNGLVGHALLKAADVRRDGKGRHTTSHRQLVPLAGGGVVVDTPGMRELGLWAAEEGVREAFEEVERRAASCRFADCRHLHEPGCAVRHAIETGALDPQRVDAQRRLHDELAELAEDRKLGVRRRRRGARRGPP